VPWAIPALYSGLGAEAATGLDLWSYLIVLFTSLAGVVATICWWKFADHTA
jgi:hypothetical protein